MSSDVLTGSKGGAGVGSRKVVITPYRQDFQLWVLSNPAEKLSMHISRPEHIHGLELAKHQVVKLHDWHKTGVTQDLINSRIRIKP